MRFVIKTIAEAVRQTWISAMGQFIAQVMSQRFIAQVARAVCDEQERRHHYGARRAPLGDPSSPPSSEWDISEMVDVVSQVRRAASRFFEGGDGPDSVLSE